MSEEWQGNPDEVWLVVESVGDITLTNCVGQRGNHVFQLAADEFLNLRPRHLRLQSLPDTGSRDSHFHKSLLWSNQPGHQFHAACLPRMSQSAVQAPPSWTHSAGRDTASRPGSLPSGQYAAHHNRKSRCGRLSGCPRSPDRWDWPTCYEPVDHGLNTRQRLCNGRN